MFDEGIEREREKKREGKGERERWERERKYRGISVLPIKSGLLKKQRLIVHR